MSSNQPSGSGQVPSWDEFNMAHEEEDEEEEEEDRIDGADETDELEDGYMGLGVGDGLENGGEEDDTEEVNEPGQAEEFGPSLPQGFGGDESQQEGDDEQEPSAQDLLNDFSIPIENYELDDDVDDPEDPLQCNSNSSSSGLGGAGQRRHQQIGPQVPSSLLPKISKSDEHVLPSIGGGNMPAVDFIPGDQPGCSNSGGQAMAGLIGPALPPDLNLAPTTSSDDNQQRAAGPAAAAFPNMDGLDDIGPAMMPPDEPQCSSSSSMAVPQQQEVEDVPVNGQKRQQRRHSPNERQIGPTLPMPSSSDEEEEGDELEEDGMDLERNGNGGLGLGGEEEDEDEDLIGPMPPAPGRSEDEEQAEYLARLAQFEANKQANSSNGLKREEWMTELPQKMLKTGAYGLSVKTSFSRSTAAPSTSTSSSAWTAVPNAVNGGHGHKNGEGPSTSAAAAPPPKRSEQDQWEERRAEEMNKERNESLMDIHQKKRKIDSDVGGPSSSLIRTNTGERRPFNRDNDMEVRGLGGTSDPAKLKERMGDLGNRFGHSSEKKFL